MPNVNYYFAFKGRWIDVHISKLPRGRDDEQIFAAFEKNLSYQENTPPPRNADAEATIFRELASRPHFTFNSPLPCTSITLPSFCNCDR